MSTQSEVSRIRVDSGHGHAWEMIVVEAAAPRATLLWLPALGVAARHYLPFAHALAARGVTVGLHEWRGHGSSTQRASRRMDWGYRQLLDEDLPASVDALHACTPGLGHAIGGHSLGGQLACCLVALAPGDVDALWLVASGAPYWRAFPPPLRHGLPYAYRFLPWLARVNGSLPGRRIGFGGNEAAGVMRDWSHTALSGRYEVRNWATDFETALANLRVRITAVTLTDDWLAPASSLRFLLDKMPRAPRRIQVLDAGAIGAPADHFAWMQTPEAVAGVLATPEPV